MAEKSKFSDNIIMKIVIAVISVAFIGLVIWAYNNKKAESANIDKQDIHTYLAAEEGNGNIPDNIKGSKDADVIIFEYADYQCPGCATTFPYISEIVDEYDGQVALVYRSFILSYHKNGTAAAAAADAAALQGYWHEFASRLYENQSEWEYAEVSARDDYFKHYLSEVSDGQADLDRFIKDMNSDEVKKKVDFDVSLAKRLKVDATPTIYIDGKTLEFTSATKDTFKQLFYDKIDPILKEKGVENKRLKQAEQK